MSGDVVIRAEGLGKKYSIGHQAERESYVALRDVIARNVRNLGCTAMDLVRGRPNVAGDSVEEFWALRDVSFEIKRGEVMGVIGRNGAGKSTLLKVLSRITEPTEGRVEIKGRVASLLEVGTGFHPELTGRENIYLNGAVLGMTHAEIRRKFDEIVDFAEVEKFLDTPVKRYSSGMYVRLAFAVAAHLEPEILIVDEVLAVGDAEFQKKCLGKMGEVAGHGRTVLFVSHNMAAVQTLCPRSLWLSRGGLQHDGETGAVIAAYIEQGSAARRAPGAVQIQQGLTLERVDITPATVESGGAARLTFEFSGTERGSLHECTVLICTPRGDRVALIDAREGGGLPLAFDKDRFRITADIAALPLVEGTYTVGLSLRANVAWADFLGLADLTVVRDPTRPLPLIEPQWRGHIELQASSALWSEPCVSSS